MNYLDKFMKQHDEATWKAMDFTPFLNIQTKAELQCQRLIEGVDIYKQTGTFPSLEELLKNIPEHRDDSSSEGAAACELEESLKENVEPSPPKRRPKRTAIKNTLTVLQELTSPPKSTAGGSNLEKTFVKLEKLSLPRTTDASTCNSIEMPPPSSKGAVPKKKGGRPKKSTMKIKKEKLSALPRDSDVIIEEVTLSVINLEEDSDQEVVQNTKAKKHLTKRSRSESSSGREMDFIKKEKRSNVIKKEKQSIGDDHADINASGGTVYEDAIDNQPACDATFVKSTLLNETVVKEQPTVLNTTKSIIPNIVVVNKTKEIEPLVSKLEKPIKNQVFSAFDKSPVKKKVEAFERLKQDSSSAIPMRVTRTKTRAKPNDDLGKDELLEQNNVKEKAKLFTPTSAKFLPVVSSSTIKVNRQGGSINESSISVKSASALKAAQAEFREREKRRREKESEALKKRDALLMAQSEEKKRIREEKQLRAQRQREVLEMEKMKSLEAQRLKDERHRQLIAEQEEKKMKIRDEQEKKRMAAKLKAIEEKRKIETQRKMEQPESAQKEKEEKTTLPAYLRGPPPLLPTTDCYDSDDEDIGRKPVVEPSWVRNIEFTLKCMEVSGEKIKNTFFSRKPQSADLTEIFEVIDPRKLKRSSSAIWHKPPRYTTYHQSILEDHEEHEEYMECSDVD